MGNNLTEDYRSRIYEQYSTNFQDATSTFSSKATQRWSRLYKYHLRDWMPRNKDAAIVDVGCGGGRLLYLFKNMNFNNAMGVDISPEQVAFSRKINSSVVEANVLDWLEEHPSSFDLITGLDIIEHLHKPEVLRFLDACYKALKPSGRLIIQTSNAESPWGSQHRYNDFTHEVSFCPGLLSKMFHLVGFRNVEIRETGPAPLGYSVISTFRYVIWQSIRLSLMIWNLAETGAIGSGVFSRVFLIAGIKFED